MWFLQSNIPHQGVAQAETTALHAPCGAGRQAGELEKLEEIRV